MKKKNEEYDYFKNDGDRYIFALTQTDGSVRCKLIGLDNKELYYDKDKATKWYESISEKIDPNKNVSNRKNAQDAMKKLQDYYDGIIKAIEADEDEKNEDDGYYGEDY